MSWFRGFFGILFLGLGGVPIGFLTKEGFGWVLLLATYIYERVF